MAEGDSISPAVLAEAISSAFEGDSPDDFSFTDSDLVEWGGRRCLIVQGVHPGGVTVVDNAGRAVLADQSEYVQQGGYPATAVFLDGFDRNGVLQGTWRIRYNRGVRGMDALSSQLGGASSEELMRYSLIFS